MNCAHLRSLGAISIGAILVVSLPAAVWSPHAAGTPGRSIDDLRGVLDAQVAAWNRGDVDAFMQGYWKSEKTEFVGSNGVIRGWQGVLDRYRRTYPDKSAMGKLTFSGLEITILSPDAALVLGDWQLEREHDRPGGVFTLVFRRFPEGWRIIHDHTSVVAHPQ